MIFDDFIDVVTSINRNHCINNDTRVVVTINNNDYEIQEILYDPYADEVTVFLIDGPIGNWKYKFDDLQRDIEYVCNDDQVNRNINIIVYNDIHDSSDKLDIINVVYDQVNNVIKLVCNN